MFKQLEILGGVIRVSIVAADALIHMAISTQKWFDYKFFQSSFIKVLAFDLNTHKIKIILKKKSVSCDLYQDMSFLLDF